MITNAFLDFLSGLMQWVSSVRPSWTMSLPTALTDLITTIRAYDAFIPVTEGLTIVGLFCTCVAAVQGFKWTIKIVDWIADIIP